MQLAYSTGSTVKFTYTHSSTCSDLFLLAWLSYWRVSRTTCRKISRSVRRNCIFQRISLFFTLRSILLSPGSSLSCFLKKHWHQSPYATFPTLWRTIIDTTTNTNLKDDKRGLETLRRRSRALRYVFIFSFFLPSYCLLRLAYEHERYEHARTTNTWRTAITIPQWDKEWGRGYEDRNGDGDEDEQGLER